jgi:hypothetical protein
MQVQPSAAALGDGQVLQNLALQRRAKPLRLLDAIFLGGGFQFCQRRDAQILVEPEHFLRPEARHSQHLEHTRRDLLPKLLEARMGAGLVQLGDDVGDRLADAGDVLEPAFRNKHFEREGESGQAVRRARVGLGSVWVAAAQRGSLRILAKQTGDLLRVGPGHRVSVNRPSSRAGPP